ncbi:MULTISPECIES: cellulose synthase [Pandoraea]|uniref:cellulose synthase n=1 Tax=Pandoraea TaxID=93217 RepID=UPI001F5C1B8F|nr:MULTISPECIES: cellulose synthase [Pandoraea]MCI3204610.1 cellulose synthase [Pandoraea sp. LA3]MDN4582638.1 cellulose synthase [Pandoraea capi]
MPREQELTILDVTRRESISSKTGCHYDMRIAGAVLWRNTSEGEDAVVGTITLLDAVKGAGKGDYFAGFILARSMEGSLVPRIVALESYVSGTRPTATDKASAAAAA